MRVRMQGRRIIVLYREADAWVSVRDRWVLEKMYAVLVQLMRLREQKKDKNKGKRG